MPMIPRAPRLKPQNPPPRVGDLLRAVAFDLPPAFAAPEASNSNGLLQRSSTAKRPLLGLLLQAQSLTSTPIPSRITRPKSDSHGNASPQVTYASIVAMSLKKPSSDRSPAQTALQNRGVSCADAATPMLACIRHSPHPARRCPSA